MLWHVQVFTPLADLQKKGYCWIPWCMPTSTHPFIPPHCFHHIGSSVILDCFKSETKFSVVAYFVWLAQNLAIIFRLSLIKHIPFFSRTSNYSLTTANQIWRQSRQTGFKLISATHLLIIIKLGTWTPVEAIQIHHICSVWCHQLVNVRNAFMLKSWIHVSAIYFF